MSQDQTAPVPIGLRIHKEAPWWVAYIAPPNDPARQVEIARIHLAVAQRPEIYEGFKALMISVVQAELADLGYSDLVPQAITEPLSE